MSADYRKIVQSLSYLAGKSGGGLNRLHAFKMLFLADRDHLRRCGCLITGDSYVAMKYGPLPVAAERLVKAKRAPVAEREYADKYLRQEPMRLLDFFLPAPAAVEYCAADPEWVEASRELFCDSAWVEGI